MRTMVRLCLVIAVAIAIAGQAGTALAQSHAHLDAVSVHLFLERSGALSEDISKISGFGSERRTARNRDS